MEAHQLRVKIQASLEQQGFKIIDGKCAPEDVKTKQSIRDLHQLSVRHRRELARPHLGRKEDLLLSYFADGRDLDVDSINPGLVEVMPGSVEELLFRYSSLHWSIPVSSGYGRRLRFLLIDQSNSKVMGLIGLCDPVFNLGVRDRWIGWDNESRKRNLRNVMDAFCLGAVPPYSRLLCSKFVAMAAASDDVRNRFRTKYGKTDALISQRRADARLALITTSSALGRSSVYNRLCDSSGRLFTGVGFTVGTGEFHFSNGVYSSILEYARVNCHPTAKVDSWGQGFRNRREVIKKCLSSLGISTEWLCHGVHREFFVVPLAKNAREFLSDKHSRLLWISRPLDELWAHFRKRWLLPRSERDQSFKEFEPEQWRLWN